MKKYVLIGGYIRSKNDGDRHYVSAVRLRKLYRLNPAECIFLEEKEAFAYEHLWMVPQLRYRDFDKLIILYPLYDGNYEEHLKRILEGKGDG